MPPLRRPGRAMLATGLLLILFLGASSGIARLRSDSSWQQMEQRADELERRIAARDPQRPVLWGIGSDGDAFAHYAKATTMAHLLLPSDQTEIAKARLLPDEAVAIETEPLRNRWRAALEELRRGAHSLSARKPPDTLDNPHVARDLLACRALVDMALLEARALRTSGEPQRAVEWSLDTGTLAADCLRHGTLVQRTIALGMFAMITAAWSEPALSDLDTPGLDLLADGLARLDGQLPTHFLYDDELVFMARWMDRALQDGERWSSLSAWRYGFSTRTMAARAFLSFADAIESVSAAPADDWNQRRAALTTSLQELAASPNPMTSTVAPNLAEFERSLREVITRLRLLRIAVDLHRDLPVPRLADPLGTGLIEVRLTAGEWIARSAADRSDRPLQRIVRD